MRQPSLPDGATHHVRHAAQILFLGRPLGSITQAARQLGLSQPTVTAQIKALEEHYGVELFHRQGGRLAITDEGLQLLPQVELLLLPPRSSRRCATQAMAARAGSCASGPRRRITCWTSCSALPSSTCAWR
jgi:molybdate transport repressor ModE-like protein